MKEFYASFIVLNLSLYDGSTHDKSTVTTHHKSTVFDVKMKLARTIKYFFDNHEYLRAKGSKYNSALTYLNNFILKKDDFDLHDSLYPLGHLFEQVHNKKFFVLID